MRRTKCILIVSMFFLIAWFTAGAQSNRVDSMLSVINKYPRNDTVKVRMMISVAFMLTNSNPVRALKVIDDELSIARQLRYAKGLLDGYNLKCSILILQANYKEGLDACKEYLEVSREFNFLPGLITSNNLLGIIYSQNGDYATALEHMLAALKASEQTNDKRRIVAATQNIGNIYNDMEDYEKALEYYKKCITITESIVPKTNVPAALYNNIGSELIHEKKYDSAIAYLEKGRAISLENNNRRSLVGSLTNMSDAYHRMGDDEKSYQYGREALELSRAIGDKRAIANNLINTGVAISGISDQTLSAQHISPADRSTIAIVELDSAIKLSGQIGDVVTREEAYRCLSETAEKLQNYSLAFSSLRLYMQVHDSILNSENQKNIIRKIAQYEFDKKEAEIKLQQQITESKLKEQELLALQGQQQLRLKQNELALSNKDRDLEKLKLQNEQAAFQKEKQEKENLELLSAQKDRINALEMAGQRRFRFGLIAGMVLLAVIGALIYRQSATRKATNQRLVTINAQLDEANKIKARFFGILSHDLRGPLVGLINFLNLQREEPQLLSADIREQHQQKMIHSAENLLGTIEDLLLWSKGQMKNFKPEIKTLTVNRLFDEIKSLYPDNDHLKIELGQSDHMNITTDENYLKTIIRNLTGNALKAVKGRSDGKVEWTATEDNGRKYLSVSDNGPGISVAQQRALFEEMDSADGKNGLGFSLIRDFGRAIHCSITVNSSPGNGSIFTLEFS